MGKSSTITQTGQGVRESVERVVDITGKQLKNSTVNCLFLFVCFFRNVHHQVVMMAVARVGKREREGEMMRNDAVVDFAQPSPSASPAAVDR